MNNQYTIVILAGGLGSRFSSLNIPKTMLKINEKPFLEIMINHLKKFGFNKFVLCIGHLGDAIEEYFGDGTGFKIQIKYAREKELLGTGGALKNAEALIEGKFVAMNGDVYLPLDFNELIKFHETGQKEITMVVTKATNPTQQELIEIKDTTITKILKRGTPEHNETLKRNLNPLMNGGVYILEKKFLKNIPKKRISIEFDILPKLIGKISGFFYNGYIQDLTNEKHYDELQVRLAHNE